MTEKYPLITLSVITLFVYFITFFLSKWKLTGKNTHRRIWNGVLLFSFLFSALLGLFSIIKVNYILDLSWYNQILELHVEGGIVLTIVGIVHLFWHLSYYRFLFKKVNQVAHIGLGESPTEILPGKISILLLLTGFVTMSVQILFLRDFFNVFYGNELIYGMALSMWFFFTGLGAFSAKRNNLNDLAWFAKMILAIAWLAVFIIAFMFLSRNLFFIRGQQVSIIGILLFSAFTLFFPCFFSGYIFSGLAMHLSIRRNKVGYSFGLETIGSILAGILVNILFLLYIDSLKVMVLAVLLVNLVLAVQFYKIQFFKIGLLISVIVSFYFFLPSTGKSIRQFLYRPEELISTIAMPSGTIDITQFENQNNKYFNNWLMDYTQNIAEIEEKVHYTMLLHEDPQSVLVLSNGNNGVASELNKYKSVQKIDYIEPDFWASQFLQSIESSKWEGAVQQIINRDYREFIASSKEKYDVIIMNLPGPMSLYFNRIYSVEFFGMLKNVMNENAILSIKYSAGINYLSDDERMVMGLIVNGLKKMFYDVAIISANQYYIISSNTDININYAENINSKGIENEYVNSFYINDYLIKNRSQMLMDDLGGIIDVNTNLKPLAFFFQIKNYLNYNKLNYKVLGIVILIFILFFFIRFDGIGKGVYISSFIGVSMEVIIIFVLQILKGNAFFLSGLVITFFMFCIALGAFIQHFRSKDFKYGFGFMYIALAICCVSFTFVIRFLNLNIQYDAVIYPILMFTILCVGFLNGAIFTKATQLDRRVVSLNVSRNYMADMMGAAFGSIFTSLFMVPVLGMVPSMLIFSAILIIFGIYVLIKS